MAAILLLSGCGDIVPQPQSVPRPRPRPNFTPATPRPALPENPAQVQQVLPGVIGADARALVRLFGEPRLDIRDPAARKLQFGNGRCVLDAYLYPSRDHREPVVTFTEARLPDGTSMDAATCAAELKAH